MSDCDIFFSYAHDDLDRIAPLVRALEVEGWSVFWDRAIPPAENWRTYIGTRLTTAPVVIVAWSVASVQSEWVMQEADHALARRVLIPILIDDVVPPLGLAHLQAADLIAWLRTGGSDFPQILRKAIAVKFDSAARATTTPIPILQAQTSPPADDRAARPARIADSATAEKSLTKPKSETQGFSEARRQDDLARVGRTAGALCATDIEQQNAFQHELKEPVDVQSTETKRVALAFAWLFVSVIFCFFAFLVVDVSYLKKSPPQTAIFASIMMLIASVPVASAIWLYRRYKWRRLSMATAVLLAGSILFVTVFSSVFFARIGDQFGRVFLIVAFIPFILVIALVVAAVGFVLFRFVRFLRFRYFRQS